MSENIKGYSGQTKHMGFDLLKTVSDKGFKAAIINSKDSNVTKYPTVPTNDTQLNYILVQNPTLIYKGCEYLSMTDSPDSYKFWAYKLEEPKTGKVIYLEKNLKSEINVGILLKHVLSLPNDLISKNKIMRFTNLPHGNVVGGTSFDGIVSLYEGAFNGPGYVSYYECYRYYKKTSSTSMTFEQYKKWVTSTAEGEKTAYKDAQYVAALIFISHEFAHTVDDKYKISSSPGWEEAVKKDSSVKGNSPYWSKDSMSYSKDGKKFLRDYPREQYENFGKPGVITDGKYSDDFADCVAYLNSYGPDAFIAHFPNRAKILEVFFPELFK